MSKVTAYLVLEVLVDAPEFFEVPAGFLPDVTAGEILVRHDYPGTGVHAFTFEQADSPIRLHVQAVYLCRGDIDKEGADPVFGHGERRLLNLVKIGQEAEEVLRQQLHEFAGRLQTNAEDKLKPYLTPELLQAYCESIGAVEGRFGA